MAKGDNGEQIFRMFKGLHESKGWAFPYKNVEEWMPEQKELKLRKQEVKA